MSLNGLNHYSIKPADLEATKNFYVDVLGLPVGYRPPLAFPGYWLYCGDHPTVHLIGPKAEDAGKPARTPAATGLFDHIAFSCTDLAEMRGRLAKHDVTYEERVVPRDGQIQIFLRDPDGVAVELNFPPT